MKLKAPAIKSIDPKQLKSVFDFMQRLRQGAAIAAKLEAARLEPYLDAFASQLRSEFAAAKNDPDINLLKKTATRKNLIRIFHEVAPHTSNAILSEITIGPEAMLRHMREKTTQFAGKGQYAGKSYTLGFVQVFARGKRHDSVTLPLFAFDNDMMHKIASFAPERMLEAFQKIMTSGNHDMLHHYTNRFLNPTISKWANVHSPLGPEAAIKSWADRHFSYNNGMDDKHPKSYESWLMLAHARVARRLEKGPEGKKLEKAIERFFRELARIGGVMKAADPKEAHDAVDYFGTLACFALLRFMRLDHPLLEKAIVLLQQADPAPEELKAGREKIIKDAEKIKEENNYLNPAIENYAKEGLHLVPQNADYFALKRLQVAMVEPWVTHLLSKPQQDTPLFEAQARVAQVNREMLDAAALNVRFSARDGKRNVALSNGDKIEIHHRGGIVARDDGPAIVVRDKNDRITETWYREGKPCHTKTTEGMETTAQWLDEKGRLHREGAPANIEKRHDGSYTEEWRVKGNYHREDGPARIEVKDKGARIETWYKDGRMHREDGPARIEVRGKGTRIETWYKDGHIHREGAPAHIIMGNDGGQDEYWYKNGCLHREDGPAVVIIKPDGTRKEKWMLYGEYSREDGPSLVVVDAAGQRTETWHDVNGNVIYNGLRTVVTEPDGTRKEHWYKDGVPSEQWTVMPKPASSRASPPAPK